MGSNSKLVTKRKYTCILIQQKQIFNTALNNIIHLLIIQHKECIQHKYRSSVNCHHNQWTWKTFLLK